MVAQRGLKRNKLLLNRPLTSMENKICCVPKNQTRKKDDAKMKCRLPVGKINPDILGKLIGKYTGGDHRIVIGPGIGEDATVIDMGDTYLVAKTDPITHVASEIGHYAVHVNANDIAAMGGKPLWFLATLLLPQQTDENTIENIFSQISEACKALGVSYCGGHTEVTSSVRIPVVVGQMLGEVAKGQLKPSSAARLGDDLIMTKVAAIEGTAIIALEKEKEVSIYFPKELILRAQEYLHNPGISIVKEAATASCFADVHALHDPTEGGVATGIFELATASDLGVEVHYEKIPMSEETKRLCEHFGVHPLGVFASGSLLITASPFSSKGVIDALRAEGINAVRIGTLVHKEKGMKLIKDSRSMSLPVYHQDELSRILG
jgi:hydrogenase expression/formation protein HypE